MGTRRRLKLVTHDSRAERKKRRTQVWTALLAFGLMLLLGYQAIAKIVAGDAVMGENYLGQPVGPGLQLVVCLVAGVVGVVMVWQYFHPKPPETKEHTRKRRKREKVCDFRPPHERVP